MKPKMIIKICIDIAMTIGLLLLMAYQLVGDEAHEWIGIVMLMLFVVHHILNRKWSGNILRGNYTAYRICQTAIVALILLCMAGSMISGIVLSRYVFNFLNISTGTSWARVMHMLCAYWGFVLMSLHLGFHWNIMISMAGKAVANGAANLTIVSRVIAGLIAIYGAIAFVRRDIWNYLTLKNHFAFFDFTEPVIFFLLDYLAIMAMFVFVGHYASKALR